MTPLERELRTELDQVRKLALTARSFQQDCFDLRAEVAALHASRNRYRQTLIVAVLAVVLAVTIFLILALLNEK